MSKHLVLILSFNYCSDGNIRNCSSCSLASTENPEEEYFPSTPLTMINLWMWEHVQNLSWEYFEQVIWPKVLSGGLANVISYAVQCTISYHWFAVLILFWWLTLGFYVIWVTVKGALVYSQSRPLTAADSCDIKLWRRALMSSQFNFFALSNYFGRQFCRLVPLALCVKQTFYDLYQESLVTLNRNWSYLAEFVGNPWSLGLKLLCCWIPAFWLQYAPNVCTFWWFRSYRIVFDDLRPNLLRNIVFSDLHPNSFFTACLTKWGLERIECAVSLHVSRVS